MADASIHDEIRGAMDATLQLREHPHGEHHERLARVLDVLHERLTGLERTLTEQGVPDNLLVQLGAAIDGLADLVDRVAPDARARARALIGTLRGLQGRLNQFAPSLEIPSKPLFGRLPLARVVPQDVHAVLDYTNGVACVVSGLLTEDTSAKVAGLALGGTIVSTALMTDYRLSAAKVLPIEAHEVGDHVWGLAACAAPFVLGYYKKSPVVAGLHFMLGAGTILASLFTDYRAARGVGHSAASRQSSASAASDGSTGVISPT